MSNGITLHHEDGATPKSKRIRLMTEVETPQTDGLGVLLPRDARFQSKLTVDTKRIVDNYMILPGHVLPVPRQALGGSFLRVRAYKTTRRRISRKPKATVF